MKKFLTALILVCIITVKYEVLARDTGHPAFQEIDFQGRQAKLLVDMTVYEKQKAHSNLKGWRLFGWKVGAINTKIEVKYIAETIFSKANRTSSPFTFNYVMTEGSEIETSINVDGSIGSTIEGKIRSVEAALDIAVRGQIGRKKKTSRTEETKLNIIVAPNTKITMRVTGNAELSNGVGRYYFFGIRFKKGEWEYIDVLDETYELIEEKYGS